MNVSIEGRISGALDRTGSLQVGGCGAAKVGNCAAPVPVAGASMSGTRGHVLARFARCLRHPQSIFHANSFTAPKAAGIHAAARVTRYKGTQLRAPAVLQRTRLG